MFTIPTDGNKKQYKACRLRTGQSCGDMVMEVTHQTLTLRPKHCKKGSDAEVVLTWGTVYLHAMQLKADKIVAARKARRKTRRRNGSLRGASFV